MKPYKCPNSKNSFRCKRTKIAEEKNVGERKKHKIRKEYNNSRPGSPTPVQFIQHRDGSVTSLVPILFSISFFSAFSLFFLSCFSLFFSHCFSLSLNTHRTTRDGGYDPNRTTRLQLRTLSCTPPPISFRSHSHRFSSSSFHHRRICES